MRRTEGPDPSAGNALLGVRGIGPARLRLLETLGIRTPGDALLYLPRRYDDRLHPRPVAELKDGEKAVVLGEVRSAGPGFSPGRGRRTFELNLTDGTGELRARWFHSRGMSRNPLFRKGVKLYLTGTVRLIGGRGVMIHPETDAAGLGEKPLHVMGIIPGYPSTEGVPQRLLRTLMQRVVLETIPGLEDPLPEDTRIRHSLPSRKEAVRMLHLPPDDAPLDALNSWRTPWHRRLIFEELLLLQLGLERRKSRLRRSPVKRRLERREAGMRRLVAALPFRLTPAQEGACEEIADDMVSGGCMQRLLQGDVGSGKTLVAAMACLLAVENGCQAALMAPTEILAEQHFITLRELTAPLGLRTALLTSSRREAERTALREGLRSGAVDLVVGTHALIEPSIRFRNLALAVIDEQHRFGVRQRQTLWEKGEHPHLLVMTATPIPRSLALTLYGDLDCTVIDTLPPGRQPVETLIRREHQRCEVYNEVRRELSRGRRAFVVLPLIEEGGGADLRTARGTVDHLRREVFVDTAIGLVHGRMTMEEREEALESFRAGRTAVLVATTVVEVGLDIPEASVMIVEHAERFGLSQLHQLRGRVGRGGGPSRCYLMTGEAPGTDALRRLDAVVSTNDGFRIAEEDLALRGPGEFFGSRQSGLPRLQVADLVRDRDYLMEAKEEARLLLEEDRDLSAPGHRALRDAVNAAWKNKFFLAATG